MASDFMIPDPFDLVAQLPFAQYDCSGKEQPGEQMSNTDPTITAQIETFTQQIVAAVEAAVAQRIQAALAGAFGVPQKRGPGRPPKQAVAHVAPVAAPKPARKKTDLSSTRLQERGSTNLRHGLQEPQERGQVQDQKVPEQRREGNVTQATGAKPAAGKKVKKATPKVARARKLQGQYLGALKSLTGADRAKVKAVAKDKGVADAVKLALSMKKA